VSRSLPSKGTLWGFFVGFLSGFFPDFWSSFRLSRVRCTLFAAEQQLFAGALGGRVSAVSNGVELKYSADERLKCQKSTQNFLAQQFRFLETGIGRRS
jgi:hypothetical protein